MFPQPKDKKELDAIAAVASKRISLSWEWILNDVEKNGILGGVNGPYEDNESNARNISHLLVALGLNKKIQLLKNIKQDFINRVCNEWIDAFEGFQNGSLSLRQSHKDETNGVIGPVWLVEPLIYSESLLLSHLGEATYSEIKKKAIGLFNFDHEKAIWSVNWQKKKINDYTFNHQLWVAMLMYQLNVQHSEIESFTVQHLKKVNKSHGCISHVQQKIYPHGNVRRYLSQLKKQQLLNKKSKGYNSFNIFALTRMACENKFFQAQYWQIINEFTEVYQVKKDIKELQENEYSFPYNPLAPELAIALIYAGRWKLALQIYREQLEFSTKKIKDIRTYHYRIYEDLIFMNLLSNELQND
jgi:hypothetical protein